MVFTIFYAWQSDTPKKLSRNLIRAALNDAADQLNADTKIVDAVREVKIDQDTQGVPGSPPVAETILGKIRECDVFVSDLTFVEGGTDGRKTPNPNVLIEYGYALHCLGDQRVVAVFNEAFGKAQDLPFDLSHRRWPIRYMAANDEDTEEAREQRRQARRTLASALTMAIRAMIRSFAQEAAHEEVADTDVVAFKETSRQEFREPQENDGKALAERVEFVRLGSGHWSGTHLCVRTNWQPSDVGYHVEMPMGPYVLLGLVPRHRPEQIQNASANRILRESLEPLASQRSRGWEYGRNPNGPVVFVSPESRKDTAWTLSQLLLEGEIWGTDFYHLDHKLLASRLDFPYIPMGAIEEILIDGWINYIEVARKQLALSPPIEIVVGLTGVKNFVLAVDPQHFGEKFTGRILVPDVGYRADVSLFETDPYEVLLPFFEKIYDQAGEERPKVRTVGKRQR